MCRIICGFWLTKRRKQHGTCQDIDVHSAALAAADGHIDRLRWCAHIRWKWWVLSDIFFRLKLASPCPQNESSRFHLWQSWNRFIRLIVTSNGFQWFLFFFGRGNTFRSEKKNDHPFPIIGLGNCKAILGLGKKKYWRFYCTLLGVWSGEGQFLSAATTQKFGIFGDKIYVLLPFRRAKIIFCQKIGKCFDLLSDNGHFTTFCEFLFHSIVKLSFSENGLAH